MMMLTRAQARQEVRAHWREFGQPDKTGKGIICPFCDNGRGSDGDGITENPRKPGQLKCWKCGFTGDSIDIYMKEYQVDHNTALQAMADYLGYEIEPYRPTAADDFRNIAGAAQTGAGDPAKETHTGQPKAAQEGTGTATAADYTAYYAECAQRIDDPAALSYLQARGISRETAAAYRLGYDPAWTSPEAIRRQRAKGSDWTPPATARLIMPVSKNHYVARAISPGIEKKYQKMNETGGGGIAIFNLSAIRQGQTVFIVEGIIDALSIIECGGAAIALNSTSNAEQLIKRLETQHADCSFVICPDNDDAGRRAAATLESGLQRLNLKYTTANISGGYKDPNDALTGNRQGLETAIKEAMEKAQEPEQLPGLLTYSDAVNIFETADDRTIEFKSFPEFGKTAKIKRHDSIVLAADTGAGKSSLAINFLNDLNNEYPCIYINLEMDAIDVLRRLTAIYSGIELDRIEGYKHDEKTAAAVNISLKAITGRKPLQVIQGAYMLQEIEDIIKRSTAGREEPTIVFIDHSLLVDTQKNTGSRYDRFTQVSEGLRKIALGNNIILFVLLQQNRAGKAIDDERPRNSSLKESGSWENDATQICFLWYDPTARRKKLLLTKNRHGSGGEFVLNYWKKTQTYTEATGGAQGAQPAGDATPRKQTKRERQKQKLLNAYTDAYFKTCGKPTLQAIAEAADVTTNTIKSWLKEYGGFMVDGKTIDPAGVDAVVEQQEFIKLTPADDAPPFEDQEDTGAYTPGGKI